VLVGLLLDVTVCDGVDDGVSPLDTVLLLVTKIGIHSFSMIAPPGPSSPIIVEVPVKIVVEVKVTIDVFTQLEPPPPAL
jgi:hypothetical protein